MTGSCTALWSARHPEMIIITLTSGEIIDSIELHQHYTRPSPGMLADTKWACYPGCEWQEDPPGDWSVLVFTFALISYRSSGRPPENGADAANGSNPTPAHGTAKDPGDWPSL